MKVKKNIKPKKDDPNTLAFIKAIILEDYEEAEKCLTRVVNISLGKKLKHAEDNSDIF